MYSRIVSILLIVSVLVTTASCADDDHRLYSNTWALEVEGGDQEADRIAAKYGYINLGKVGNLRGIYQFQHKSHPRRSRRSLEENTQELYEETTVKWAQQQIIKRRVKRSIELHLNDPLFPLQWYLHNTSPYRGYDHNVLPVWRQGVFGKDIVVSILDDGIEMTHQDLAENYDPKASYDFNSNDPDPTPRRTLSNENRHGTRCAGEVAAALNNSKCIVGVAPKARIGGVRMLDGEVTDAVEASSLSLEPQHIEIYSASWGPDDDGKTVDGPGCLARRAFNEGITEGRHGLGSIYVWASGNGGFNDNCNCDGYTNSIYTLSISSATEHGGSPWYSEACSSTLATTFSSGAFHMRKIVTTDINNVCTESHTGTSASAPIAAGILALALEVNRNLTWRDMQHLVVRTSKMDKLHSHDKQTNGVGHQVSHKFGYGLLDATALVQLARVWRTVPTQHVCHEIPDEKIRIISNRSLRIDKEASGCQGKDSEINYLEHVEAVISLDFSKRGDLTIFLTSPNGTISTLLAKRPRDYEKRFTNWAFMTTHCWGENPRGKWTLEVRNDGPLGNNGTVNNWQLRFYGTAEDPDSKEPRVRPPVTACSVECRGGCTGPAADQCKRCANFLRKATGECVPSCTKNEYASNKQCIPCSPTCKGCQGPSNTDCTSCLPPLLLLNNKCVSLCPTSWFKSNDKCLKCDPSCRTCTGKATQCTSCKNDSKLVDMACKPLCSSGFFKLRDGCAPCHGSCAECNKSGPRGCLKCRAGLHFNDGECSDTCPPGMYPDLISKSCKSCHPTCSTCSGARDDDCLACVTGLFRVVEPRGLCKTTCPKGRYGDKAHGACVRCDDQCATCDAIDHSHCTSCPDGKYLDNYKCVQPKNCSSQSYPSPSSRKCERCYSECVSCTGPAADQCVSCTRGFYLYESTCVLRCPVGTFPFNKSCQRCSKDCTSCYGPNKNQCLSCEPSLVLSESRCVTQCPFGTYKHHITKHCELCHPSCKSCSGGGANECLSCKDGYTLNATSCTSKCPSGEVSTKTGCTKCHTSCSTCSGTTDKHCISCSGMKFLNPKTNTCSYQCPDGFYGDIQTAICQPCLGGCKTCKEANKCSDCEAGLVKNGDVCQSHCPSEMYVSKEKNTCTKCDPSCLECLGTLNHCIKCDKQKFLQENKCISVCPHGLYHDMKNNHCEQCDKLCAQCSGPSGRDCTKCRKGLYKVGNTCLQSCPKGYYYNTQTQQCDPCDFFCQQCNHGNGLLNCSKCIPPFVLHHHYCVRNCPSIGWYLDTKTQKCNKCHSSCTKCVGPTEGDCVECSNPNAVLYGFSCKLTCPIGYFKNFRTRQCERCHPTCTTCAGIGQSACTACVGTLRLHHINGAMGVCVSGCQACYYKDAILRCQPCHKSCKSCYGPARTNCLSCGPGYVHYQNMCHKGCPAGTFFKRFTQQCVKCHPICKTCVGPMAYQCLSCLPSLFLAKSTCVIQCPSKTIADFEKKVCNPCKNCLHDQQGKPKNRSVQDPSIAALRFILDDPKDNGVLMFTVMAIGLCVTFFVAVLGVLQLYSTRNLCFKRKYTIIKASFKHANEDEKSLMNDFDIDNEDDAL